MSEALKRHFEPPIYRITRGLAAQVYEYLYDLEVSGLNHVPKEGGFLLASNHASFFDPPLVGYSLPRPIYYFARQSLMEKGFSKWLLGSLATIPVDRDGPQDVAAIRTVMRRVQAGNGLLVFPEGTRTLDGELKSAKSGVGLLACKNRSSGHSLPSVGHVRSLSQRQKNTRMARKTLLELRPCPSA